MQGKIPTPFAVSSILVSPTFDLSLSHLLTESDTYKLIVPDDTVRTWKDYDDFYGRFFHEADAEIGGKTKGKAPARYRWGHVVRENFSEGEQGIREVKDILSTIKGTLVEMPLLFLDKEDIAKEGFSLNALTEEIYT